VEPEKRSSSEINAKKLMRTLKFAKTSELEGKQQAEEICFLYEPTAQIPSPHTGVVPRRTPVGTE
jgi:hypothetical protein